MLRLLLPALVPSWRFFDRIGPAARVDAAFCRAADESPAVWRPVVARPARLSPAVMLGRLFWNPLWNEALYLVTCAERLLDDPSPAHVDHLCRRVADLVGVNAGAHLDARRGDATDAAPPERRWLRVRIVETLRQEGRRVERVRFVSEAQPVGRASRAESPNGHSAP